MATSHSFQPSQAGRLRSKNAYPNSDWGVMSESNALASALFSKLEEQIELTEHLITLIPPDKLEWKPLPDSFRVCDLLGHLLECLAGFCAALHKARPDRLAHLARL